MSSLAPPPVASASRKETLNEPSSPPPQPIGQTPTPPAVVSPAPLVSPPSPPASASASNSTSEPPSSSKQDESPPPSLSPPSLPPDNSPLAPPPRSSSVSRPPPPTSDGPPSLSAPPPPQAFDPSASVPLPVAPAQLAPPSSDSPPASQDNPPPSPPSPVTSSPPSESFLVTPPPDAGTPSSSTHSQPPFPPAPEKPIDSPVSPTLPETPPLPSIPSPSIPITPVKPTPSTTPGTKSPSSVSQLVPPSTHTSPSSSSNTSKTSDDVGGGTVLGFTVAGVVLIFFAIFFVIFRKKRRVDDLKRRMDDLGHQYRPPATFSVNSDGYCKQVNQTGNSKGSDTGNTGGSYRGYASHGGPSESVGLGGSKTWFTYQEITDMTHGFSRENLLGEGGFGCVYKGWLPDGKVVAVKQLKSGSGQGEREFRAEVEIISRVHHRHLVSLVGYCIADNQRSLVYEFVPNNTLEHHLHGKSLPVIDWPNRLKIAIGSARGLAYLHEDCHPRIIHRDIKSANILLDNSFEAQVADFGLAKLSNDTYTHVSTRVMGTFGYMAPEYASSGKLTDRSDVFSFGVVLLELITGRKPVDPSQPLGEESLVQWARPRLVRALETEDFEGLADPRLENNYVKSEMFRMLEAAASCVRHSAPKRPRMVQVLRALDNEELPDLSNGLKFGQSTVFESRQYSADIQKFQRMAFGSGHYSSDYGQSGDYDCTSSGGSDEHRTRDAPHKPLHPWKSGELGSGKYGSSYHSEPQGISRLGSERNLDGSHQSSMRGYF